MKGCNPPVLARFGENVELLLYQDGGLPREDVDRKLAASWTCAEPGTIEWEFTPC